MIIASKKRKENIAEYILYMWQIEDLIRANGLDIDKIKANVIDSFQLDDAQKEEMTQWYESLIDMMRREGVTEKGHLQINKNILNQLVRLHQALLNDPEFPEYSAEFYRTLPFIVELRSKAGDSKVGEIETCFTALYGMLMMRLQKKELSEDTLNALKQITRFINLLSRDFHLDEEDKLFKHNDDGASPENNGSNPLAQAETNRRAEAPTAELPEK
ncbi:MAG: DUF4924 family protein [[Clostridium] fimetarium]|nr:DUF4924 family protein [[Clostridium] fimetarium]